MGEMGVKVENLNVTLCEIPLSFNWRSFSRPVKVEPLNHILFTRREERIG